MRRFLAALVLLPLPLSAAGQDNAARDAAAQTELLRQQQSDAFGLQLRQSLENFRAGTLTPAQRLELDSLQRDQRLRQSETFYRQQVEQSRTLSIPAPPGAAEAELMRFRQQNAVDESRAAEAAAETVERTRPQPKPAPNPEPQVIWRPVLR